jgi:hypothetical protein
MYLSLLLPNDSLSILLMNEALMKLLSHSLKSAAPPADSERTVLVRVRVL